MTESPSRIYCHFCRRELDKGEGRYRFIQDENEVECCPQCFDQGRPFPKPPFGLHAEKQLAERA